MRKLAHVERITNIKPIQDADSIEVAVVLGWECIVKKDKFKKGDLAVYVEIDSVLPERPEFEFMRKNKFRIKTIKLRGQISQGLLLPVSMVKDPYEGKDVTEELGIKKYMSIEDTEENNRNKKKSPSLLETIINFVFGNIKKRSFPFWVKKTDEERIQNIPYVIEKFADRDVYVTEKIDYQSVTFTSYVVKKIFFKKQFFVVCSRNLVNNDKKSLYWKIFEKYNINKILKKYPNITIQGEQGSESVQGNKYMIIEPRLWVFNVIDHVTNRHFDYDEMKDFCDKNGLEVVPLIRKCKLKDIGSSVSDFVEFSKGKSVLANIEREGIVVRSINNGKKELSFKVINPNFLLKYE